MLKSPLILHALTRERRGGNCCDDYSSAGLDVPDAGRIAAAHTLPLALVGADEKDNARALFSDEIDEGMIGTEDDEVLRLHDGTVFHLNHRHGSSLSAFLVHLDTGLLEDFGYKELIRRAVQELGNACEGGATEPRCQTKGNEGLDKLGGHLCLETGDEHIHSPAALVRPQRLVQHSPSLACQGIKYLGRGMHTDNSRTPPFASSAPERRDRPRNGNRHPV